MFGNCFKSHYSLKTYSMSLSICPNKSIFDKRKIANNAIDYRLQSIVPALELEIDSEKVIDYRDKSIFDKRKEETNQYSKEN